MTEFKHPRPVLLAGEMNATTDHLKLSRVANPLARCTLCDLRLATRVTGAVDDAQKNVLVQHYDAAAMRGIDERTVRVFRHDPRTRTLKPVWNSGINTAHQFVWAKTRRPGTYVPIGLPRDRLLREALREMARERSHTDLDSLEKAHEITRRHLAPFYELEDHELQELREFLTWVEIQADSPAPPDDIEMGPGAHPRAFHLPGGMTPAEFKSRLAELDIPPDGLPEEKLFFTPDPDGSGGDPPWPRPVGDPTWAGIDLRLVDRLKGIDKFKLPPFFFSKNWWMYGHDIRHTGRASGWSNLRSTTVGTLIKRTSDGLDGRIVTQPAIVYDNIYVGTAHSSGETGGVLYKLDLCGRILGKFQTSGSAFYGTKGIGGTPAVTNGKVYISTVYGKIYCIDAATMTKSTPHPPALWVTDLKNADSSQNQPCNQPSADAWSGPLVISNRVYIGCGEGEQEDTYGFVYCLDATTGKVVWLFCTCKFDAAADNAANTVPQSIAAPWAAAAGFTVVPDAPETGCSVWSSCAYDSVLNRIYVGTGNSQYESDTVAPHGTLLPDQPYGSGLLSLDADTGAFAGFYQPDPDDSYRPTDEDIDVPGGPTIFFRGDERVLAFGSKNGSFFLLDPDTLQVLGGGSQKRQLLPRSGGTGHPGNRGAPLATVDPPSFWNENKWGVMATPAVHRSLERIFVGVGGYSGIGDQNNTPFVRALDWNNLNDAWPTTSVGNVDKYTTASPPLYTSSEAGLSSPAVVNDVVFMATSKAALYAFDADTGVCLWSAPDLPIGGWPTPFCLGPAIYGNYVVIGVLDKVYIFTLPSSPLCIFQLDPNIYGIPLWPPHPPFDPFPPREPGPDPPPPWTRPLP